MKRAILLLVWIVSLQYVMAQDYPDLQINIRYNPATQFVSAELHNISNDTIIFFNGHPSLEEIEPSYMSISETEKEIYYDYEEKFPLLEYDHVKGEYKRFRMFLTIPANGKMMLERNIDYLPNLVSKDKLLVTVRLKQLGKDGKLVRYAHYKQWISL